MGMREGTPTIICLCGSTRFKQAFLEANRDYTINGFIVLTVGHFGHTDGQLTEEQKKKVDVLHFHKIDLADKIVFLNEEGYIGESTRRELGYALLRGKHVVFLYEKEGEAYMSANAHEVAQAGMQALRMMGEEV